MAGIRDRVYLPAVRVRQGELRALSTLSSTSSERILPLLLTGGDIVNAAAHLSKNLIPSSSMNLLIDPGLIFDQRVVKKLSAYFQSRSESMLSFGFSVPEGASVADFDELLKKSGTRFSAVHLHLQYGKPRTSTIQRILALSRVALSHENDFTLILDFGHLKNYESVELSKTLTEDVLNSIHREQVSYNRIIILSGSFPSQISWVTDTVSKKPKSESPFSSPRLEIMLENLLRQDELIQDNLRFGDYSVFHASEYPDTGNQPHPPAPNIRYAQNSKWILLRGKVHDNKGFYELCAQLLRECNVDPPDFSLGDNVFHSRAKAQGGPGGASQWLEWSSSHHIAFTIRQLSNLGVL